MKYAFIRDELAGACAVRMAQSMSRSGNCCDNAMMESLWGTMKKEPVHGRRFRTHDEARPAVFEWFEDWHQRTRIHGSLG